RPGASAKRKQDSSEHLLHLVNPSHQGVDLLARVVEGKGCAGGGWDAEAFHERLCAVMAGADGDALFVQDRADIVRMNAVEDEGDSPGALLGRADQANARNRGELLGRVFEQALLMSMNGVDAKGLDVVDGGAQTDGAGDVRRASLELVGQD